MVSDPRSQLRRGRAPRPSYLPAMHRLGPSLPFLRVATRLCPVCGTTIPDPSAVCGACGSRIPPRWRYRFVGKYNPPRFQIDPANTPPQRDVRWVALVLGVCSLIVSGFLLSMYFLFGTVLSGSGLACGGGPSSSPCTSTIFEYLFLVPGLALLAVGAITLVVVFIDIL
jgi:hypothetical protein